VVVFSETFVREPVSVRRERLNKTITLNGHSLRSSASCRRVLNFRFKTDPLDLWTTIADDACGQRADYRTARSAFSAPDWAAEMAGLPDASAGGR
jgi:hypothetical protein